MIEYETYTRDLTAFSANEMKAFFANRGGLTKLNNPISDKVYSTSQ
jgi:hypothetical protein